MKPAPASFDPEAVPVQLAATVLLVDDRPDLHVLCLRRRAGSNFVGGMTVFPGGGVDEHDAHAGYADFTYGRDDVDACARLEIPDASAYWVAVVRETLEEVGVLLACDAQGRPCAPDAGARHRHAVDHGERTLLDVLREESLLLDAGAVHDVGRWITPVGPPRRYDTRFFIASMPADQVAVEDSVEAVHAEWRRPADALAEWHAGGLVMLPPTVAWLQVLATFPTAAELVALARTACGPGVSPRVVGDDRGSFRVLFPGQVGYEETDARDALAWVYDVFVTAAGRPRIPEA